MLGSVKYRTPDNGMFASSGKTFLTNNEAILIIYLSNKLIYKRIVNIYINIFYITSFYIIFMSRI